MEVKLEYPLQYYLKKYFGFNTFKGQQEAIIKNLLEGKDAFVIMPTGGGKSMCYQLPALILDGTAIVISPLIALMKNQVDALRNFGTERGIAHFLNSSLSKAEIQEVKDNLLSGKTKLLYVAPESLVKEDNILFLRDIKISFYAIDEAHCISEWGHDFRPEYRRLRPIMEAIGQDVPVMALTATATPKVQQDIQKNLNMLDATIFKSSFNRPNLYYEVRPKYSEAQVNKEIIRFIKNNPGKSGIVYCMSRKKVEEFAETLQVNGIRALPYHAGLDAETRRKNQDAFLMEEIEVIVATIAFGMGIDKPDVRYVIHYDMPKSLEGYYQETGRAGRDDGEGICLAFYNYEDIQKLEKFIKDKPVAEQEIAKQLLLETISYAESSVCRRKHLLHYFGEEYKQSNCGSCDNCLHPKPKFDGQELITTLLEAILTTKQQFKSKHIVNIITGKLTTEVKKYKHDQLEVFGKGYEYDEVFWFSIIRQAIIARLVEKEIENYGVLKITEAGMEFLKNPHEIMLVKPKNDFENEDEIGDIIDIEGTQGGGAVDRVLFALLKDLRKDIARKEGLPPYVIFQDPSLEDMAIQYPITMEEMKNITGVGPGKAMKYGQPFIELIAKYVKENEIERPQDLVVKSVVNKSGLKVYIIQSIDRKVSLEDMANAKGLTFEELLSEIESIVYAGTKINIDYFINEYIDEEHQEIIYDYFKSAESDSIELALEELGADEFTETEIRLMRIKFLSDFAN